MPLGNLGPDLPNSVFYGLVRNRFVCSVESLDPV